MTRFDLISPRPRKDGKTYWQKVGAAFPRQNGGFSLVLDALPLPDNEGRVSLLMTEPKPRDGQQGGQSGGGYSEPASSGVDDDEIPF
ncbi:hypothetical protein [uncultured Ruegeria sp.]|uniref:hypothetical protein n=1 Tax=uncultured Ruegeria sp. TaxID=259304 RepID=UPI0026103656|nr:hypothetical protein [uncultured Ruegeria sp.]